MTLFKKMLTLAAKAAIAYSTPSKADDVATAMEILHTGYSALKNAEVKKQKERDMFAEMAAKANSRASAAGYVVAALENHVPCVRDGKVE